MRCTNPTAMERRADVNISNAAPSRFSTMRERASKCARFGATVVKNATTSRRSSKNVSAFTSCTSALAFAPMHAAATPRNWGSVCGFAASKVECRFASRVAIIVSKTPGSARPFRTHVSMRRAPPDEENSALTGRPQNREVTLATVSAWAGDDAMSAARLREKCGPRSAVWTVENEPSHRHASMTTIGENSATAASTSGGEGRHTI
mmetsp:Transcript_41337/g.127747  ORF Transcript_41337/g.127747 Transcript_41337/m.127747 type:complete len:206 (-) Transcript_41337:1558-2175(-)